MNEKISSFRIDLYPEYHIYAALYTNVTNAGQLLERLIKCSMNCTAINATLVPDIHPVLLACNQSVHNYKTSSLKTRSMRTEVLLSLSLSNGIRESLKTFGVKDTDQSILFVDIRDNTDSAEFDELLADVKGDMKDVDELANLCDVTKIKSLYKITEDESLIGSVADSVTIRVATKNAL